MAAMATNAKSTGPMPSTWTSNGYCKAMPSVPVISSGLRPHRVASGKVAGRPAAFRLIWAVARFR
jgi:hypothetical protein